MSVQYSNSYNHHNVLISFIITYYNLPVKMLQECIDSILTLSLSIDEREIIVIDDGSNYNPIDDLEKYRNDIIYIQQENGGLSSARNKGIEVATGEYLQFVDGDDQLIKSGYDYCLNIIRHHPDTDMVIFDFKNKNNNYTVPSYEEIKQMSGVNYMLQNNIHGTAWGYLFRRTTLGELRFTPCIYHEDEEFTPQLLIRAKSVYPTIVKAYYYHKHKGSITTNNDEISKAKRLDDFRGVLYRLQNLSNHVSQLNQLALQRRLAQLTMDYIYQVIVQQRSKEVLNKRIEELNVKGLFPLPDCNYSQKYIWFRKVTNTRLGRTILLYTLPLLKRER